MDVCIGYVLQRNFSLEKSDVTVEVLIQQVTDVYSVIRFEFIEKLKQRPIPVSVKDRLAVLEEFGEIKITNGVITKV